MIVLVMGVSGSGKTTIGKLLASRLGWEFHDADDFHPPANIAKMKAGEPLDDDDRRPWLAAMAQSINSWLDDARHAVLACSALKASYRDVLVVDPDRVRVVYLKASFELIQERMEKRRGHFMPAELLKSQFDALEEPTDAIAIDVSGTPEDSVDQILQGLGFVP